MREPDAARGAGDERGLSCERCLRHACGLPDRIVLSCLREFTERSVMASLSVSA